MTSAPFHVLPNECWLNILELLPPDDYRSLLLVSKRSASLIEPFLLREIKWEWRPVPFRRILLLFRAIIQKPERASEIQHLSLVSRQHVKTLDEWEVPNYDHGCLENFQDILQHSLTIAQTAGFDTIWTDALESGNPYAFVSVLLSQLQSLRSLSLDYSFVWQGGFPGLMLRHALTSSSLSQFDSLSEVDYGGNIRRDTMSGGIPEIFEEDPGYPECNTEQFPAWFHLPSLQSLSIWLRTKKEITLPGRRPDLSQLRRLILSRTTIKESQVPEILSLAPYLKTLHLGMTYHWGKELALKNGPAILQGFGFVKESVTNISFGIEYFPPTQCELFIQRGEKELTVPFDGILNQFPNLRVVEMPVHLLAGWSATPTEDLTSGLPDTIEQLCLRADYESVDEHAWHEDQLLDLIAYNAVRLRKRLPRLRHIAIHKWSRFRTIPRLAKKRNTIQAMCAEQGIDLAVMSDHLSNGIWTEDIDGDGVVP